MASRVTQSMLNTQLIHNLNKNMVRMDNSQNQLATGRRINKPSDDPVGISYSMRYRSELAANTQYHENVDSAISWLEHADTTADQVGNLFQRIRELAVKGANGTNPQIALNAIASEVEQLQNQLITLGNSQFNGKYVFNGQMTDIQPYSEVDPASDTADNGKIVFEIGVGVKIAVNVSGNTIFGSPTDADNTFKMMSDLHTALITGDFAGIDTAIGQLDTRVNKFLEVRADIGAKVNRIQLSEERLKDININLQQMLSKTEDADMAELITKLKTDEAVYQASLSVGSRIIRPSLIDFLR
ncbi:MAG: flagellar hook-associated protein FlgL [Paenibacillaceae bacterium]